MLPFVVRLKYFRKTWLQAVGPRSFQTSSGDRIYKSFLIFGILRKPILNVYCGEFEFRKVSNKQMSIWRIEGFFQIRNPNILKNSIHRAMALDTINTISKKIHVSHIIKGQIESIYFTSKKQFRSMFFILWGNQQQRLQKNIHIDTMQKFKCFLALFVGIDVLYLLLYGGVVPCAMCVLRRYRWVRLRVFGHGCSQFIVNFNGVSESYNIQELQHQNKVRHTVRLSIRIAFFGFYIYECATQMLLLREIQPFFFFFFF